MAASEELDLELIAAFIDGRLSGIERNRAIKLLRESEAAFEVYADALRARADLGEADVVPINRGARRRPRAWLVGVPIAAAAALLIAILPRTQMRREPTILISSVESIAAPLAAVGVAARSRTGAPAMLVELGEHKWTVMRGGGSDLPESTTAFRLGVRATDLHLALSDSSRDRAERLADEMVNLLQSVSLADEVRDSYVDVRSHIRDGQSMEQVLRESARAEHNLDELLRSTRFGIGKWFAAAEFAARSHSVEFFTSPRTAQFLDWSIERGRLAPDDVELLRQVKAKVGTGLKDADFEAIRGYFEELIQRHGR